MHTSDLAVLLSGWKDSLLQQGCERLFERYPELGKRYSGNRRTVFDDMAFHIDFILAAFRYESPIIFYNYLVWNRNCFTYLHLPLNHVQYSFEAVLDACAMLSPEPYQAVLMPYRNMVLEVFTRPMTEKESCLGASNPLSTLAAAYFQAVRRGDRNEAFTHIDTALAAGTSPQDIYMHVFQCCLREIGHLWFSRQASIAEEHYFSFITQQAMAHVQPMLKQAQTKPPLRVLAACVKNEAHDIGIRMVSDFLEQDGWIVRCCGANTPNRAILDMLDFDQPKILALSATMMTNVEAMEELIKEVRKRKSADELKIIVGGYPFIIDSNLWRIVGADGMSNDARQAVQIAREW